MKANYEPNKFNDRGYLPQPQLSTVRMKIMRVLELLCKIMQISFSCVECYEALCTYNIYVNIFFLKKKKDEKEKNKGLMSKIEEIFNQIS